MPCSKSNVYPRSVANGITYKVTSNKWHSSEDFEMAFEDSYLPDIKTASYCPRPAAIMRCFNLLSDGRTSKAGGSANNYDSNTHAKQGTDKQYNNYDSRIVFI